PTAAISLTSPAPVKRKMKPGSMSPAAISMPTSEPRSPAKPSNQKCASRASTIAGPVSALGIRRARTSDRAARMATTTTGTATQSGAFMAREFFDELRVVERRLRPHVGVDQRAANAERVGDDHGGRDCGHEGAQQTVLDQVLATLVTQETDDQVLHG